MKNFYKSITFLTVFTLVLNVFSVLILTTPVKANEGDYSDTMSNDDAGAYSQHIVSYEFRTVPITDNTFTIHFDNAAFKTCSGIDGIGVVTVNSGWTVTTVNDITCTITVTKGSSPSNPVLITVQSGYIQNTLWTRGGSPRYPFAIRFSNGAATESGYIGINFENVLPTLSVWGYWLTNRVASKNSSQAFDIEIGVEPTEGDTITFALHPNALGTDGFDCTGLVTGDVSISSPGSTNWSVNSVSASDCSVSFIAGASTTMTRFYVNITADHIVNPSMADTYDVIFTGDLALGEEAGGATVNIYYDYITNVSNVMSSHAPSTNSSQQIEFNLNVNPVVGDTITFTLPSGPNGFDCTGLDAGAPDENGHSFNGDFSGYSWDWWQVINVDAETCTFTLLADANPDALVQVTIDDAHMVNPSAQGHYDINVTTNIANSAADEVSTVISVPIYTTNDTDVMSSYKPGLNSSHNIFLLANDYQIPGVPEYQIGGDISSVTFPHSTGQFDCTGLQTSDVSFAFASRGKLEVTSVDAGTCTINFKNIASFPQNTTVLITVSDTHLKNPTIPGVYGIVVNGIGIGKTVNVTISPGIDILSNYTVGEYSSHQISYTFTEAVITDDTFTATLPSGFDCTGLVVGDITIDSTITDGWEVSNINLVDTCAIEITAIQDAPDSDSTVTITIANNSHIKNPLTPGTYNVSILGSYEPDPALDLPVVILAVVIPEGAGTGTDTMSSLTKGAHSSHVISYTFSTAPVENETFTINLPEIINNDPDPNTPGFVCTGLTTDDVTISSGWTVTTATPETCVVVVTAGATPSNPVEVTIAGTNMVNPSAVDIYDISISGSGESKIILVPIVDSDTVNVNGFVTSNLYFDLDTGTGETPVGGADPTAVDCSFDSCLTYGDSGSGGGPVASNYTVDLGNLTRDAANKSGDIRLHTAGMGFINSIYFDLSTNAASGVVLTYQSHYGELRGPGHNADANLDYDIPTTNGTDPIIPGTSGYGIQLAAEPVYKSVGTGTQTINCGFADAELANNTYCIMGIIDPGTGENTQLPLPIYTVTGPLELGRGKIDVAAAIDGTVVPGNYSDEVTFIATSTF